MEAPKTARHTSLVHTDSARGMEPLGRLATPDVRPVRAEISHAARVGEFRSRPTRTIEQLAQRPNVITEKPNGAAGKRETVSSVVGRQSSERPPGQPLQEVKWGQNETKVGKAKTPVNSRESTKIEYKKYPTQAQKLENILRTTVPLEVAVRSGILRRSDAEIQSTEYSLPSTARSVLVENAMVPIVIANPERVKQSRRQYTPPSETTPVFPANAGIQLKEKVWILNQVQNDKTNSEIASAAPRNDVLQALPILTVEANRALQQVQETVRVLTPEIASAAPRNDVLQALAQPKSALRIATQAEAQAALMTGETEQVQKTFTALSQTYNPEQARTMLATAIKTRTRTMSLPRQALLLEEMIKTGQAEGFEDDPELILQIIARKQITEEIIEAQVYEPAMRARLANLENAAAELAAEKDEATGADLVAKLGIETAADRSPIAPDGKRDGGYDIGKAKTASLGKRKVQALYEAAKAFILANPAAEYVSKIVTRKATDQEVYNIKFAQQDMDKIMKFAYGRGMAMLDRMIPV